MAFWSIVSSLGGRQCPFLATNDCIAREVRSNSDCSDTYIVRVFFPNRFGLHGGSLDIPETHDISTGIYDSFSSQNVIMHFAHAV